MIIEQVDAESTASKRPKPRAVMRVHMKIVTRRAATAYVFHVRRATEIGRSKKEQSIRCLIRERYGALVWIACEVPHLLPLVADQTPYLVGDRVENADRGAYGAAKPMSGPALVSDRSVREPASRTWVSFRFLPPTMTSLFSRTSHVNPTRCA